MGEEHIEYKYKGAMQKLEGQLSQMAAQRMTAEDDFAARQKQEQERADKYRAKYESVKQHVKTLEMQKTEYTRVNEQLRQQNNQFRAMITQLQNQLRAMQNQSVPQNQMMGQADPYGQMGGAHGHGSVHSGNSDMDAMSHNMHNMANAHGHGHPHGNGNGNNPMMNDHARDPFGQGHGQAQGHGHRGQGGGLGLGGGGFGNGMNGSMRNVNEREAANVSGSMADLGAGSSLNNLNSGLVPSAQRELWGKRTKVISDKGTKKRILVEWHFVTSDGQSHTVVLQHTQDTKPKTRRMLWVDGSEKYNNKSSASSFRVEIDKDVVVVSIDQLDHYQYRLTVNNASYEDAFALWQATQQPQAQQR